MVVHLKKFPTCALVLSINEGQEHLHPSTESSAAVNVRGGSRRPEGSLLQKKKSHIEDTGDTK